jgi:hypothetical protein
MSTSSPEHDFASLQCGRDVAGRVPDAIELGDQVPGRQAGRGGEPMDMPVAVDATPKPVRARVQAQPRPLLALDAPVERTT